MINRLEAILDNKIWSRAVSIVFPMILVLFSLIHIGEGITATDTGYNYGNFIFMDGLDNMWKFPTYLANAVGALFTCLPFGTTMMGLNFYTSLFKVFTALGVYFICVKVCKMRKETAFLGEMIALGFCWCPTALLYNYMTYFLFTMGALFIFFAFKMEKSCYLVLAGVCLGLNFMVRLPNVAEIALILCVWFGGIVYKKNLKRIVQDTLLCMLGYFASLGIFFVYIAVRYGLNAYVEGVQALFAMTENATSYSAVSMVLDSFKMYLEYSKWFFYLVAIAVCGIVGFMVLKNKLILLKKIGFSAVLGLYVFYVYRNGLFNFDYRYYTSMFFWGVLFLMVALVLCAYTMFFFKRGKELRLLSSMAVIMILITPIGSNNHLYSPINNLFLTAPVVLSIISHLLYEEKRVMMRGKVEIFTYPIKAVLIGFVAAVLVQSICFGANFVFRDGTDGQKRVYEVVNNAVLAGMKTTEQNAKNLQGLNDYLVENDMKGEKVLLYGNVPAIAFYFSLEPAISSTWPDLKSFSYEKFEKEIDLLEKEELPLVITDTETRESFFACEDTENSESSSEKKLKRLQAFLENNGYVEIYSNNAFVVYEIVR